VRNILKTVLVTEQVQNEYTATSEEFSTILENKSNQYIAVTVNQKDLNNRVLLSYKYTIDGDKYAQIMSANPPFAPEKPANEYRESDLWHMVDLIRTEQGHD